MRLVVARHLAWLDGCPHLSGVGLPILVEELNDELAV